jgi:hypothetical protein
MLEGRPLKFSVIIPVVAVFLVAVPAWPQQVWHDMHINLSLAFGGTDDNFPGCGGRILGGYSAALQAGKPLFAELAGEWYGTGGEDCLPITPPTEPGAPWGELDTPDSGARVSLGIGRHFLREHLNAKVRAGVFGTVGPFASAYVGGRIWVFTTGFEFGQVNAKWTFDNGVDYRKWSRFGTWHFGLRF